jgi:hypothetical protein
MMNPSTKKNKQTINRELFVGGGAILLMLPIIMFAIFGAMMGALVGIALFTFTDVTPITALILFTVYTTFLLIFGVVFWRVLWRIRLLFQRKHHIKAEQERIAHLIDTSSAEKRLKDYDLELEKHVYDKSISKKEKTEYKS